jgi:hypothetical protein
VPELSYRGADAASSENRDLHSFLQLPSMATWIMVMISPPSLPRTGSTATGVAEVSTVLPSSAIVAGRLVDLHRPRWI